MSEPERDNLILTLKRVVYVLNQLQVPYVLAGGMAVYARGGVSSEHDVDFLIREQDVPSTLDALTEAGFRTERPPEGWLVKAYDDNRLVDLIYRPVDRPVTDATLADSERLPVNAIRVPVLSATELMVHTVLTFSQHRCDYAKALPTARSLREQIDWRRVRRDTEQSPYAYAFLVLLERLGVVDADDAYAGAAPNG